MKNANVLLPTLSLILTLVSSPLVYASSYTCVSDEAPAKTLYVSVSDTHSKGAAFFTTHGPTYEGSVVKEGTNFNHKTTIDFSNAQGSFVLVQAVQYCNKRYCPPDNSPSVYSGLLELNGAKEFHM